MACIYSLPNRTMKQFLMKLENDPLYFGKFIDLFLCDILQFALLPGKAWIAWIICHQAWVFFKRKKPSTHLTNNNLAHLMRKKLDPPNSIGAFLIMKTNTPVRHSRIGHRLSTRNGLWSLLFVKVFAIMFFKCSVYVLLPSAKERYWRPETVR